MSVELIILLALLAYIAGIDLLLLRYLADLLHRLSTAGANPCRRRWRLCVVLGTATATAGALITAYTVPALAVLAGLAMIISGIFLALPRGMVPWHKVERGGGESNP